MQKRQNNITVSQLTAPYRVGAQNQEPDSRSTHLSLILQTWALLCLFPGELSEMHFIKQGLSCSPKIMVALILSLMCLCLLSCMFSSHSLCACAYIPISGVQRVFSRACLCLISYVLNTWNLQPFICWFILYTLMVLSSSCTLPMCIFNRVVVVIRPKTLVSTTRMS